MGLLSNILGNAGVVEQDKLRSNYGRLLTDEEDFEIGFNVFRDVFLFTNKRLIVVDTQGMTGKKRQYLSIPYAKITRYSIETAGHFDLDAELKIWIGSDPDPLSRRFNKKVNIYDVQAVLSRHVLS